MMRFGARDTVLPGPRCIAAGAAASSRGRRSTAASSDRHPPGDGAARPGAGLAVPSLMTLAMSGAKPERCRPRLRPRQHDGAGRRRDRPRAPRHVRERSAPRPSCRGRAVGGVALTRGYHVAYLIGAVLVLAAIAVGLTVVKSDRPARRGLRAGDRRGGGRGRRLAATGRPRGRRRQRGFAAPYITPGADADLAE